jgi:tetratricopeptide (TPR) repeat protein
VIDLDARLARGPLRARSLWSADRGERLEREMLRRRRRLVTLCTMLVGACVALAAIGPRLRGAPNAQVSRAPAVAPASMAQFADGSVAELLGRDSQLRVDEDTAHRVVATLTGGARFRVVPNHDRTFEVQSNGVRVRVLGTTFSVVQLASSQTQVLVEHGRVEVAWLGGATVLETGEGGAFPPADGPAASTETPPVGDDVRPEATVESAHDEAADLLQAADVARIGGRPDQAVALLRNLYDRHPTDRRAPVAAFTAGRILLDDMGRPGDAAAAFERARALWPRGPLAEDALSREADAWQKAGRPDRGRALAAQYLELYPQGRHVVVLRALLAP